MDTIYTDQMDTIHTDQMDTTHTDQMDTTHTDQMGTIYTTQYISTIHTDATDHMGHNARQSYPTNSSTNAL